MRRFCKLFGCAIGVGDAQVAMVDQHAQRCDEAERDHLFIPSPGIARAAADWWSELWVPVPTRATFRAELFALLQDEERLVGASGEHAIGNECFYPHGPFWLLQVDYDPKRILLEAVRMTGVPCRGVMFSADGLLPYKTAMKIFPDCINVREGRTGQWERLG